MTPIMRRDVRKENHILRSLSSAVYGNIFAASELVELRRNSVVEAAGDVPAFVFFPADAVLSRTVLFEDGRTAGAAIIGSREATGLETLATASASATTAVVTLAGTALRSPVSPLRALFAENAEFRLGIMTAMQAMMLQLSFNAACHRFHSLEQRYARWLLETSDRTGSADLQLTHEVAARLLGVRRAGLTMAANLFERRSLIVKKRGVTSVSDRSALESVCCGCYAIVRREYERLLGNGKPLSDTSGSITPGKATARLRSAM